MKTCKLRNLFPIISAFFLHACVPTHWALKGTRRSGGIFSKSHRGVDAQTTEEAAILSSSRPSLWEVLTGAALLYISSNL